MQEAQLLALLSQDDDERVEHVKILAEVVEPDAISNGGCVGEAEPPHVPARRHRDVVCDVEVDQHLHDVVQHKDRLRDREGLRALVHGLAEILDHEQVAKAACDRHVGQVVHEGLRDRHRDERDGRGVRLSRQVSTEAASLQCGRDRTNFWCCVPLHQN